MHMLGLRSRRSLQLAAASCLALLVLLLASPKVARACSCPDGPAANVRWPPDAASDAAVDTPIVVAIVDYEGNPSDSEIQLADATGAAVALEQVQRIPPAWNGCGAAELAFVRPARSLDAGTTYTVSITFSGDSKPRPISTFTVSDHAFVPEPKLAADITYLKAYLGSCVEAGCDAFAEVRVALANAPENLLWLVIRSSAAEHGRNQWPFRPEGMQTVQSSVLLPPDDDCVDIRIYGREGRALFEDQRCAPDRCASTDVISVSTCGDPGSSTIDAALVPADSCKGPTVPRFSRGRIVDSSVTHNMASEESHAAADTMQLSHSDSAADNESSAQPTARRAAANKSAPSCSARPERPTASAAEGLVLLSACWTLSWRRRRAADSRIVHA